MALLSPERHGVDGFWRLRNFPKERAVSRYTMGAPAQMRQLSEGAALQKALIALVLVQCLWLGSTPSAVAEVDLSGTYNIATLTPVQRPEMYGESL